MAAEYSLAARCCSETISMMITMYLGLGIVANELLPKTKGNGSGFGFLSLGFGLAFGFAFMMLGYISALLSPATVLSLWIIGKISGTYFLALAACDFAGAFLGACLVYLHYAPHFKSVPEPPAAEEDALLQSRDALSPAALSIASYNTRPCPVKPPEDGSLAGLVRYCAADAQYYFKSTVSDPAVDDHAGLVEQALGSAPLMDVDASGTAAVNRLRRRSVQVADVHRRLKDMELQSFQAELHGAGRDQGSGVRRAGAPAAPDQRGASAKALSGRVDAGIPAREPGGDEERQDSLERERLDRLYAAAIVADQNAKLSVFATRPAIRSPVFNFLCEFMGTTMLTFGVLQILARADQLYAQDRMLFTSTAGVWIGFYVFVCVLGLGGPTGFAANAARDFAPRVAHWLLPIPGKGSSEFGYAPIPFIASLAGGAASAGLYLAVQTMNRSNVDEPYPASPAGSG